jgi:hypothetical protein
MAGEASFEVRPDLTAIAVMHKNEEYIADSIAPRALVGSQLYEYTEFTLEDSYNMPDDAVGRTSKPNVYEFSSELKTGQCKDYALDTPVPNRDIENARNIPNFNPLGVATEQLMEIIALNREKRLADVVFNLNTYPSAQRVTLSGTDQFSDFTNSDPIGVITDALSAMLRRANVMVLGREVADKLQLHPQIIQAVYGKSTATSSIVPLEAIATLFGLKEVKVGDAWYNTAKKGQTASFSRVWGKHVALFHRSTATPNMMNPGVTFMLTAQFGDRFAGVIPDHYMGARGGQMVRAGESVDEKVISNLAGYFIKDAVE